MTTPLTRERVRHELAIRELTVASMRDLGPRMRRVAFDGPMDGFVSAGPADHVKVFFPDPVTGAIHAPRITADGLERPDGEVISRDYTPLVRDDGVLELDFVLHGDDGPASHWASHATVGDPLVVAGPRGSHLPPAGARGYVLGGDESALPAISRWLDVIGDAPVTVLIEVTDAADESYPLPAVTEARSIHWLHRGDAAPGSVTLLDQALRELGDQDDQVFWWFAGEATSLIPVRRYLRRELGLDKTVVDVNGYWKRDIVAHDHHAPVDPDDPED